MSKCILRYGILYTLCSLLLSAQYANGQNMIKNGGFEYGTSAYMSNVWPCVFGYWEDAYFLTSHYALFDIGLFYLDTSHFNWAQTYIYKSNKILVDTQCQTLNPNPWHYKGFTGRRFFGIQSRRYYIPWDWNSITTIKANGVVFMMQKPIAAGSNYLLRYSLLTIDSNSIAYFDGSDNVYCSTVRDSVTIGISDSDTLSGTIIDEVLPIFDRWTHYSKVFRAPVSGAYLTTGNAGYSHGLNFYDNYQLFEYYGSKVDHKIICKGDSLLLTPTVTGDLYFWNDKDSVQQIWVKDTGWHICYTQRNYGVFVDSVYIKYDSLLLQKQMHDTVICKYDTIMLQSSFNGAANWLWNNGEIGFQTKAADSGWYSCKAIYANGCYKADSMHIGYVQQFRGGINHDTIFACEDPPAHLTSSYPNYLKFIWNTSDTTSSINPLTSGVYWCTSTDKGLCFATDTFNIQIEIKSFLDLNDTSLCKGTSIKLDATHPQYNSYSWSTGAITPSIKVLQGGLYMVTAGNGVCTTTDSIWVTEYANPQLHLPRDTAVCFDELQSILLDAGQWKTYAWYPTGEHTRTIYATYPEAYSVMVTDSNNCVGTDTALVEEECPDGIYLPNAFTPNGDGINDIVYVSGYGIAEAELRIYNRWGVEIFSSNNINKGWDGKLNNQYCSQDVYTYSLTYKLRKNSSTQIQTGTITLLR